MKESIININFANAVKQAERLDEVVSRLESAASSLSGAMDTLDGFWKGASAEDYRSQGMDVHTLLQKDIKYISKGIKATAREYRKSEMAKLDEAK